MLQVTLILMYITGAQQMVQILASGMQVDTIAKSLKLEKVQMVNTQYEQNLQIAKKA